MPMCTPWPATTSTSGFSKAIHINEIVDSIVEDHEDAQIVELSCVEHALCRRVENIFGGPLIGFDLLRDSHDLRFSIDLIG